MAITEQDRYRMGGELHSEMIETLKHSLHTDWTGGDIHATWGGKIRNNRAAHVATLRHLYPIPGPIPDEVQETDLQVQMRDGVSILVRVYTPLKESLAPRPVIIMFHEGGWVVGDLSDEDSNCRMFARDLGAVCISVDYRLAPENVWPKGVEDAYDVVRWCAATASPDSELIPGDPLQGFVVGGASAGGNLSAVVSQMARDDNLYPPLTGQYLCVPALIGPDVVPDKWQAEYRSRWESKIDPWVKYTNGTTECLLSNLKPVTASPLFSPLLHPNLRDLPPAFFQLGGLDPMRDEGLIYERVLREENAVETRLNVYDGFGHMFWTSWPTMQRSRDFADDTRAGMKWLLEVGISFREKRHDSAQWSDGDDIMP